MKMKSHYATNEQQSARCIQVRPAAERACRTAVRYQVEDKVTTLSGYVSVQF
jgi:hypothetical protein